MKGVFLLARCPFASVDLALVEIADEVLLCRESG